MPAEGHNDGFHVLDEFVCEAIRPPSVLSGNSAKPGRNAGMLVLDELTFDARQGPAPEDVVRAAAVQVAAVIAASPDPAGTAARFHRLLADELAGLRLPPDGGTAG